MQAGRVSTRGSLRLPLWLRRETGKGEAVRDIKTILREGRLNTVCEEARCPNLGECFQKGTATFLLLGDLCTRGCTFCSVEGGTPAPPDPGEPERVAESALTMGLSYVVLTSVTRDDLSDGGALQFSETINAVRRLNGKARVEVLTPDFGGNMNAVDIVCEASPDVYNHNIETVPSLYKKVRPEADYLRSLELIRHVKENCPGIITKSGIMLGFGEKEDQVLEVMEDLLNCGCDLITIGQYMQPSRRHLPVAEYIEPDRFKALEEKGKTMGFRGVYAGPLVRSSFNAESFQAFVEKSGPVI